MLQTQTFVQELKGIDRSRNCLGFKINIKRDLKLDSETVLQVIEANVASSTESITHLSPVWFVLHDFRAAKLCLVLKRYCKLDSPSICC